MMIEGFVRRRRDAILAGLLLIACFFVLRSAPLQQAGDSRYSMLLTENLLRHGDFHLERYNLPEPDYRLEHVGGHTYYSFPPGTSVLSIPFVAAMHLRGMSAVRPDGRYDVKGELALDARLAALLAAAFGCLVYLTSRLLLPVHWSLAVALVSVFGTQVFSTASRSVWSDTWGIALVGAAAFILMRSAIQARTPNLPLLATLETVAYVVRPTNSLVLVVTGLYLLATTRPLASLWPFVATGAAWLGIFFFYSWTHFHSLLPNYFVANRLAFFDPATALFGNLISPSRGLLIYVPAVVAIVLMLARFHTAVRFRPLVAVAASIVVAHFVVLSGFPHWWGGHAYGARLTTSLVPWFALLGILAVDAMCGAHRQRSFGAGDWIVVGVTGLLCAVSIAINAIGAYSRETERWNALPENVDSHTERLWSWTHAQFMAPFVERGGPSPVIPSEGLRVGTADADPHLGPGWYDGEGDIRWTAGRETSTVRFAVPALGPAVIEIDLRAYLPDGKPAAQRLTVKLNGRNLAQLTIQIHQFATYAFAVPAEVVLRHNVLTLDHPDAMSPHDAAGLGDTRTLGVALRSIRWIANDQ